MCPGHSQSPWACHQGLWILMFSLLGPQAWGRAAGTPPDPLKADAVYSYNHTLVSALLAFYCLLVFFSLMPHSNEISKFLSLSTSPQFFLSPHFWKNNFPSLPFAPFPPSHASELQEPAPLQSCIMLSLRGSENIPSHCMLPRPRACTLSLPIHSPSPCSAPFSFLSSGCHFSLLRDSHPRLLIGAGRL